MKNNLEYSSYQTEMHHEKWFDLYRLWEIIFFTNSIKWRKRVIDKNGYIMNFRNTYAVKTNLKPIYALGIC